MGVNLKLKDNAALTFFRHENGYIPLPYLETIGNVNIQLAPAIDLAASTLSIETVFQAIDIIDANSVLYGFYNNNSTLLNGGLRAVFETANSTTINIRSASTGNVTYDTSEETTIYHAKNSIKINNVVKSSTSCSMSNTYALNILVGNFKIRLKSIKVTYKGSVIRDVIPAVSTEFGHRGEYCLYDISNSVYYYASSTGSFTCNEGCSYEILNHITTAYVKDCPNVSCINILRTCPNLTRVRLDIGNVSGSIEELLSYTSLSGFNDNYEPQTKPRLVGTWTINDYYTNDRLTELQGVFDGLTIVGDSNYCFENLLEDGAIAVQSIDDTHDTYNPAAVIYFSTRYTTNKIEFADGSVGSFVLLSTLNTPTFTFTNYKYSANYYGFPSLTDTIGICRASYVNGTFVTTSYDLTNVSFLQRLTNCTDFTLGMHHCDNLNYLVKLPPNITQIRGLGIRMLPYDKIIEVEDKLVTLYLDSYNDSNNHRYLLHLQNVPTTLSSMYGQYSKLYLGKGIRLKDDVYLVDSFRMLHPNATLGSRGISTWYEFTCPILSYSNNTITITVTRTTDLSHIYYKKSSDDYYTEITNGGSFTWDGSGYIEAKAEFSNGDVYEAERFYSDSVADPTFTLDTTNKTISINCTTPNATIYYTIDGTYPTLNSNVYSESIATQEDIIKVRCFAVKEGMNESNTISKICVLNDTLWGTDGDSSYFAVQTIDSTKPNYNPAVAIILRNYFNYKTDLCYFGGGYYLSKTDAASITNIGTNHGNAYFGGKTTVTDSLGLVTSNTSATYTFSSFNEFKYFTGVTSLPNCANASTLNGGGAFTRCTNLQSIILPSTLTTLGTGSFGACIALNCDLTIPSGVTVIPEACFNGAACNVIVHDGITTFKSAAFSASNSTTTIYPTINRFPLYLTTLEGQNSTHIYENDYTLPATCVNMTYGRGFFGNASIGNAVHWLPEMLSDASITNINGKGLHYFFEVVTKVYVGDGSSAEHDDAIVAAYKAKFTNAAAGSLNKFDSWYNYLHPTT